MNSRPNYSRRKRRKKKDRKVDVKKSSPNRADQQGEIPSSKPAPERKLVAPTGRNVGENDPLTSEQSSPVQRSSSFPALRPTSIGLLLTLLASFVWAYWQTFSRMVAAWEKEPDYSHGYLVIPFAMYFLWARRDTMPAPSKALSWLGLILIGTSIGIRYFSAIVYIDAVDAWSMLVFLTGGVLMVAGIRFLWWALPSIAFLFFMIPLPFRAESFLSRPLQRVATEISCWCLQFLGQPAIAEGNTIMLGEHTLEVEQACSGLRIFVGIVALAFAYLVLVKRSWWERGLLIVAILPIALAANAARIVATGLLYNYVSSDAAHKFTHDLAGWLMIPLAAGMFGLFLVYLGRLVPDTETVSALRHSTESSS